mmetsp:Transcript_14392/g.27657  ORF Transcript_14392/g.27657 Transcript_14392/m.27657 type:complete len:555 (-) Transcript_14392:206-1870(-)
MHLFQMLVLLFGATVVAKDEFRFPESVSGQVFETVQEHKEESIKDNGFNELRARRLLETLVEAPRSQEVEFAEEPRDAGILEAHRATNQNATMSSRDKADAKDAEQFQGLMQGLKDDAVHARKFSKEEIEYSNAQERAAKFRAKVENKDLLVAIPCATHRHNLVYSSRMGWREGIKTFVASNGTQTEAVLLHGSSVLEGNRLQSMARTILDQKNDSDTNRWHRHAPNSTADLDALFAEENKGTPQWEKWGVFPDEEPPFTGFSPGDRRMLAVVRLANQSYAHDPGWKWMVYGDDDVLFFPRNLLQALSTFDPDLPYLIADNVGSCCDGAKQHRRCQRPPLACQPPSSDPVILKADKPDFCIAQPAAAPCTKTALLHGYRHCPDHRGAYWFHGGSGAVFSRALLNEISAEDWMLCEEDLGGGGVRRVSECVWQHGYGPTMLSRDFESCRFGGLQASDLLSAFRRAAQQGRCDARNGCLESLARPISAHMASASVFKMGELWKLFNRLQVMVNETSDPSHRTTFPPSKAIVKGAMEKDHEEKIGSRPANYHVPHPG